MQFTAMKCMGAPSAPHYSFWAASMEPAALLKSAFDHRDLGALAKAFEAGATRDTPFRAKGDYFPSKPLGAALWMQWPEALRLCLARVDISPRDVVDALRTARRPHLPMFRAILDFCPPDMKTCAMGRAAEIASERDDVIALRWLLDAGVDPNWCGPANDRRSLLHEARDDTARLLLDRGANPNGPPHGTVDAMPPLGQALHNVGALRVLLTRGATLTEEEGDIAIGNALLEGPYESVRLLEAYGYRLSEPLSTHFCQVLTGYSDDCVRWLLERGADPDDPRATIYLGGQYHRVNARTYILDRDGRFPRAAAFLRSNPPCTS